MVKRYLRKQLVPAELLVDAANADPYYRKNMTHAELRRMVKRFLPGADVELIPKYRKRPGYRLRLPEDRLPASWRRRQEV